MAHTDWQHKSREQAQQTKCLKKGVKELTKSREEWKEKSIRHKARADKLETDLKKPKQIDRNNRLSIVWVKPPKNHSFSLSIIQLSILLVGTAGVSFKSVSKIFIQLNLHL